MKHDFYLDQTYVVSADLSKAEILMLLFNNASRHDGLTRQFGQSTSPFSLLFRSDKRVTGFYDDPVTVRDAETVLQYQKRFLFFVIQIPRLEFEGELFLGSDSRSKTINVNLEGTRVNLARYAQDHGYSAADIKRIFEPKLKKLVSGVEEEPSVTTKTRRRGAKVAPMSW